MKDTPEIAPEIRGLLEEIVANPRSAIRLVPRRALRTWFDTGETVRASDVVRTSAERHLVEMHREELAALLCEASWISYWKAPMLSYRPIGADGTLYHPTQREPAWRKRAERAIRTTPFRSEGVELLRQCLNGVSRERGWPCALASLSLVPRENTRHILALTVPWDRPLVAIAILKRIVRRTPASNDRLRALTSLGARLCSLARLHEAKSCYEQHAALAPQAPYGWICSFNLACFTGDEDSARRLADGLGRAVRPDDLSVVEVLELLRDWVRTRTEDEVNRARKVSKRLSGVLPEVANLVCRTFDA